MIIWRTFSTLSLVSTFIWNYLWISETCSSLSYLINDFIKRTVYADVVVDAWKIWTLQLSFRIAYLERSQNFPNYNFFKTLIHISLWEFQGVNVSFSDNFAYAIIPFFPHHLADFYIKKHIILSWMFP